MKCRATGALFRVARFFLGFHNIPKGGKNKTNNHKYTKLTQIIPKICKKYQHLSLQASPKYTLFKYTIWHPCQLNNT
jgi:hypothetical protein